MTGPEKASKVASAPSSQPNAPRRQILRRLLYGSALLAVVLVLSAGAAAYTLAPYAVIVPGRIERTAKYHDMIPADRGLNAERFDAEVEPGLWLHGWFVQTATPAYGTVILLHGHASCKESMFPRAKLLAEHGYNSLMYDSRGHGENGGSYCTFGYYEHRDCSRYLDAAEQRFGPLGPTAIYGESFGGAVALQTMADDQRFCCGIVECTFATLRGVVQSDARHWLPFSSPEFVDSVLRRAGEIAHFPPGEVRPEDAASEIRCPVLMIHGTTDTRIPITNGERIFHHLKAAGCEWYPVAGAGHGGAWHKDGPVYERHLLDFLALHMR